MKEKPLVVVECVVYNHEPYLKKCLEGFIMQKTTFPFVVMVHDDKSTDGSVKIINDFAEKYPNIIKPFLEEQNQWSKKDGSLQRKMYEANQSFSPKYIAICEGDDFWIDPLKLQKQIDILEQDTSLMAVVTDSCVVDINDKVTKQSMSVGVDNQSRRYTLRDFFKYNLSYPTGTVCWRNSHPKEVEKMFEHTITQFVDDWNLWIAIHTFGDFYYLNDITSAYRIQPTSITHTNSRVEREKASMFICKAVADILPEEYADIAADLRDTRWAYLPLAKAYYKNKQYARMMGALMVYFVKNPRNIGPLFKKVWSKLLKKIN